MRKQNEGGILHDQRRKNAGQRAGGKGNLETGAAGDSDDADFYHLQPDRYVFHRPDPGYGAAFGGFRRHAVYVAVFGPVGRLCRRRTPADFSFPGEGRNRRSPQHRPVCHFGRRVRGVSADARGAFADEARTASGGRGGRSAAPWRKLPALDFALRGVFGPERQLSGGSPGPRPRPGCQPFRRGGHSGEYRAGSGDDFCPGHGYRRRGPGHRAGQRRGLRGGGGVPAALSQRRPARWEDPAQGAVERPARYGQFGNPLLHHGLFPGAGLRRRRNHPGRRVRGIEALFRGGVHRQRPGLQPAALHRLSLWRGKICPTAARRHCFPLRGYGLLPGGGGGVPCGGRPVDGPVYPGRGAD